MSKKPLEQNLFEEPFEFEFFQAVRLLEKLYPERLPVGSDAMPSDEVVRFRSRVGLDFPSSEIHQIERVNEHDESDTRLEMMVNFMGMVGVSGVMPTHYTELVLDRIRHRDTALWAFLDIFTHRAVSLFYRAWSKYRFPVAFERGDDNFTAYLYDIAGLGTKGLRGRMAVEDEALLSYAGLIAQLPHSASALENIVSDHFGIEARVEQYSGQWLPIEEADLTNLGVRNSVLGQSAIVGSSVWDQQSKFRLRLGPLPFNKFRAFLPDGSAHASLRDVVRLFAGDEFDSDVNLVLNKREVPATILTTRAVRRPALGWTTWLKTKPVEADDRQVVLN
ncbi:MAG: type VI secretion system baseplate subunit TssG [Acidobacteria bacterium]|nr:type VI secretion system baseplate subunit TssG [Acidobacteriota bacterium]MCW5950039.1 type VI secretion system baseplate subunit TssG [Pyrinomonadaceae bacterium]